MKEVIVICGGQKYSIFVDEDFKEIDPSADYILTGNGEMLFKKGKEITLA